MIMSDAFDCTYAHIDDVTVQAEIAGVAKPSSFEIAFAEVSRSLRDLCGLAEI